MEINGVRYFRKDGSANSFGTPGSERLFGTIMQSSKIKEDWAAALVICAAKLLTANYMVIVQSRLRKRLEKESG